MLFGLSAGPGGPAEGWFGTAMSVESGGSRLFAVGVIAQSSAGSVGWSSREGVGCQLVAGSVLIRHRGPERTAATRILYLGHLTACKSLDLARHLRRGAAHDLVALPGGRGGRRWQDDRRRPRAATSGGSGLRGCDLWWLPDVIEDGKGGAAGIGVRGALSVTRRVPWLGIVFLEAWSFGIPVVGGRAGAVPDVVEEMSKGSNRPRRRCCNPRPRSGDGCHGRSCGRGGASIRAPDDCGESGCPRTSPGWRADRPACATTCRRLERASGRARELGGAARSACSGRGTPSPTADADSGREAPHWSKRRSRAREEEVVLLVECRARLVHALADRALHGFSVLLQLPELPDQSVGVHLDGCRGSTRTASSGASRKSTCGETKSR